MKKFICLLVIAFLFASCGTKNEESYFIPKDAVAVMYVNLKTLSEKGKDLDSKNLSINTLIEDKAPEEVKAFVSEFMTSENLNKTFRKEFILGFGSFKRLSGFGGLALPIKDAAAFEAFIQPLLEKLHDLEKEENVGQDKDFTVYSTRELAIGWNNKTALIIGANNYAAAELKDLTNLKKDESILATNYFDDFFDVKQDMGLHITSTPLGDAFDGLLNAFAGVKVNLEDNNLSYHGSFEDDHIYTNTNLKLNKDFTSLLGYKKWMTTSYSKSMLDALPNSPLLLAKISIDPEAYFDHITSLTDNKVLPVQAREELKKNLESANSESEREIGMGTKDIAKIFDGSVMFAITEGKTVKDSVYDYNYYTGEKTYTIVDKKIPNMYGVIAIKDKSKFDNLLAKIQEKGAPFEEVSPNYYEIEKNAFMVITDDFIFFTNDVNKANEIKTNGKLANKLSDFEHKDKLSHSIYLYTKGNIAELSNDFAQSLGNMYNPYGGYNAYGSDNTMERFKDKSIAIYDKYFGENHYFVDTDGGESFTYTKGDKNSLIQTVLYGDELAKTMNTLMDDVKNEEQEMITNDEEITETTMDAPAEDDEDSENIEIIEVIDEDDDSVYDIEETVIEDTESN
ncbi:DUF4836 family protein [Olleya sp. HaHaR_3_96]|uniref:DUF4836 family protein n=1 Tax=Olleya sp. HaHaR_3_96 TaxID=2745560 RepID=UPI001C5021C4|nr:DUF4836 family protein [Olleya sp. HaHaR_3_96]QXP59919.1 DUF4836 family protein [Olleya sp. HaHaR_3_96]